MSTIIAVKKNQRVCLAADSLTTFGDSRQTASMDADSDKIFQYGENYIGIVGSAAHQMVVQSALEKIKKADFSSRLAIFKTFNRLHEVLKDKYFLNPKDEDDDPYESSHIDALIVNPHGIFGIYALREVFEYKSYWAIGSGSEFALGAAFAAYDTDADCESIAKIAIAAGAEFNVSTALPLTCYSVEQAQAKSSKNVLV